MTYTLGDYDLQKGDWVNLFADWWEYYGIGPAQFEKDRSHKFIDSPRFIESDTEVLGVLRPSIIMREKLDDILEAIPNARFGPQIRKEIDFIIVEPRKPKEEPKKSLAQECADEMTKYNEPRVLNSLLPICERLEALEKKLGELKK